MALQKADIHAAHVAAVVHAATAALGRVVHHVVVVVVVRGMVHVFHIAHSGTAAVAITEGGQERNGGFGTERVGRFIWFYYTARLLFSRRSSKLAQNLL